MRHPLILALAALPAALSATALAAPPWSEPRTVARPGGSVTIDYGRDGSALVSWAEGSAGPEVVTRLGTLLSDGRMVKRGLADALLTRPVVYGRDRVVLLRRRNLKPRAGTSVQRSRLDASFGTIRKPLGGRSRRVAVLPTIGGIDLDADDRGEIAVAWVEVHGGQDNTPERVRLRVALGRANRGFGRPRTLATGGLPTMDSQSVAVAYGAGGDLLVAYSTTRAEGRRDRPVVAARVRRAGGSFGPAQVLGRRQPLTQLVAATARDGRMVVAWGTQDSGEEANLPWVVRAAVRPAGRGRFGRSQLLDPGEINLRVPGQLALGMSPDGRATIAWSNVRAGFDFPRYPVRVASTGATGGFGPVTQLADNGAAEDMAVGADGTALVAWGSLIPGEDDSGLAPLYAAVRPPNAASFGGPEQISSPGVGATGADVAFDPRTGRPTAVWQAIESGESQLATRTG
jgi:hypothetical protein